MPKNSDYAKIAIACKELGLDRKQLLADRYSVNSAKDLTPPMLRDLYTHFASLGWKAKQVKPSRGNYIQLSKGIPHLAYKKKLLVIWQALGWKISGLNIRSKKQFGVDRFIWLQDRKALDTLARDLNKRARARGIDPDAIVRTGNKECDVSKKAQP